MKDVIYFSKIKTFFSILKRRIVYNLFLFIKIMCKIFPKGLMITLYLESDT